MLDQGALKNSACVRHRNESFCRDATDTLSSQKLLQLAALPSSVFIILHDGCPLVVGGGKHSQTANLVKLDYSAVASVLTDDNFIYLGTAKSLNGADTSSASAERSETYQKSKSQSPVAHFCVNLSQLSMDEVKSLGSDSIDTELITHPVGFLRLSSEDRLLYSRALPILDWHKKNQFCPSCGSVTSFAHGGYKRICQNSNCLTHNGIHNVSYPRVDPSVICAVISTDNEHCLLVRKSIFPSQMYSLIAGFTDAGENLEEACVREVHEEVGVDITNLRYHGSQFWPKPSVLMAGYIAEASSSQPLVVDSSELESARWFDRSQVVDMLMRQHDDRLFLPPSTTLAHQLIKSWLLDSAFT